MVRSPGGSLLLLLLLFAIATRLRGLPSPLLPAFTIRKTLVGGILDFATARKLERARGEGDATKRNDSVLMNIRRLLKVSTVPGYDCWRVLLCRLSDRRTERRLRKSTALTVLVNFCSIRCKDLVMCNSNPQVEYSTVKYYYNVYMVDEHPLFVGNLFVSDLHLSSPQTRIASSDVPSAVPRSRSHFVGELHLRLQRLAVRSFRHRSGFCRCIVVVLFDLVKPVVATTQSVKDDR